MKEASRQQLVEIREVLREQQQRYQEVAEAVRLREAPLVEAARKARKREIKVFAASMGFRPDQKMARRILESGRAAFDPTYNSLSRGVRLSGANLDTL